jgi:hypothetical protein
VAYSGNNCFGSNSFCLNFWIISFAGMAKVEQQQKLREKDNMFWFSSEIVINFQ